MSYLLMRIPPLLLRQYLGMKIDDGGDVDVVDVDDDDGDYDVGDDVGDNDDVGDDDYMGLMPLAPLKLATLDPCP